MILLAYKIIKVTLSTVLIGQGGSWSML